jgi:ribosomal protein S27AE
MAVKQKNKCAKCSSPELLFIPSMPGEEPRIAVGERGMQMVAVSKFVCGNCGYIEEWVRDAQDLEKLRKEYGSD